VREVPSKGCWEWKARDRPLADAGELLPSGRHLTPGEGRYLLMGWCWEGLMVPRSELVQWLNEINWRSPAEISPEAEVLIEEHLSRIRVVTRSIVSREGVSNVEAHGIAQTAGHNEPEGEGVLDDLFNKVTFRGAGVRTALIANIAAGYCWEFDRELSHLPNPWSPLVVLYGMGYTSSTDDDVENDSVSLLVGYSQKTRAYRIV